MQGDAGPAVECSLSLFISLVHNRQGCNKISTLALHPCLKHILPRARLQMLELGINTHLQELLDLECCRMLRGSQCTRKARLPKERKD